MEHVNADITPIRHAHTTERNAATTLLTLALVMAIPVVLSVFFFANQSLRLDEAQSLWQTSRGFLDIFTIIARDVHVPLYHTVLHFWRLYVGDTVIAARGMSMLFYLLSIPALYFLGRLAYNRSAGLFAALLFAISPFMNWYGNEIRMYTLFTLLVILNQFFFIKLFKDKEPNEHHWAGYIFSAILGVFSHYFFFLNLVSQAIFFLMRRRLFAPGSFKRFTYAAILVLLAFAPWIWYVIAQGQAGFQDPVLATPTSVNLFSTISQFLFGFQNDHLNAFVLSLWPATILFGLLTLRKQARGIAPETEYFLTTIIVSVSLAFVVSLIIAPIFVSRYLIFTVPSLYLLLTALFSNYSAGFARFTKWSLAMLMILGLAMEIQNPTAPVKENYERATAYLNAHVSAQDVVVLSAPFTVYPVEYYYRGSAPIRTLPAWNQYAFGPIPEFSPERLPGEVKAVTANYQNVYLLLSYDQGYEQQIKEYFDSNYQRLSAQTFSNDLNLYVYKLRYDTPASAVSRAL